jgi:monoamine oxidase
LLFGFGRRDGDIPYIQEICGKAAFRAISMRAGNLPETMTHISRRSFLAATAGLAAAPAFGQSGASSADIAIIGAGAAGIAAARRIVAAGKRPVILEAAARAGGRCLTDASLFGVPVDLGAHWIHMPEINPVAKLALAAGLDVYPAPPGQRLRVGRRYAREGELEDFLAALVRCNRAIQDAARGKVDVSCLQALPKDLLDLQATVEFFLGPWGCGKDLREISAMDFAKSLERDVDAFCRQGFGTLLMKLAEGLPLELSAPVTQVNTLGRGGGVEIVSSKGRVSASAVIVTVSTNVLTSGRIKFSPDLPKRQLDACDKLSLGSYDRIILELPGNPLGLQRDDLMFEKAQSDRTAAVLANVGGSTLAFVDVGGKFGRDLAAHGKGAMTAFATEWLTGLYGTDIGKAVGKTHATQWNEQPYALGAFSAAAVGGQPSRRILMEPLRERVFFAGEAAHETLWGTVGGAWESGERAAAAALRIFGIGKPEPAPQPQRQPKAKRPRRQQL